MRAALLTIATLASFVYAQFEGLPQCAIPCVVAFTSGSQIANCNSININCICSNQSFLSSIACCLTEKCSPADQDAAVKFAQNLCSSNGVTNLPTAVSCVSTATSGSSATGSGATSATTSGTSRVTTSATSASAAGVTGGTSSTRSTAAATSTSNAGQNAGQMFAGVGGIIGGLAAVALL